jgi:hypothetical protein
MIKGAESLSPTQPVELLTLQIKEHIVKLSFLTKPAGAAGGVIEALLFFQELARESMMGVCNTDAPAADC